MFGKDMPGKPPFLESSSKYPQDLVTDRRLTSREYVICCAYMAGQQYYEVQKVCTKWLCEALGYPEKGIKKAVKKLVELGILQTEEN